MPVGALGFTLKPDGFFERNPALDVPAPRRLDACRPPLPSSSARPDSGPSRRGGPILEAKRPKSGAEDVGAESRLGFD